MKTLKELMKSADPVAELRMMVSNDTLADFDEDIAGLKMPIPRGYHHKDNLEHSIRVLDNAINAEVNGPDVVLRTAALLHDIGKPATRKLGTRKSVSFDGHEVVGSHIARRLLNRHGFTKDEVKEITLLIRLHMRSHGFDVNDWTDSGVRRLIKDTEDEATLSRLLIIFKSDATTTNAKKLNAVHRSVDKLAQEIERVQNEDKRSSMRPALNGHEIMEIFELKPGRELGRVMKFLNSDEGVSLTREEALTKAQEMLSA